MNCQQVAPNGFKNAPNHEIHLQLWNLYIRNVLLIYYIYFLINEKWTAYVAYVFSEARMQKSIRRNDL